MFKIKPLRDIFTVFVRSRRLKTEFREKQRKVSPMRAIGNRNQGKTKKNGSNEGYWQLNQMKL
jgi:hypothetical protein